MKSSAILCCLLGPVLTAGAGPGRAPADGYTLHEWGTFTTLSASDGTLLPGVQREEEPLPEFVESHEGMLHPRWMRAAKGWMRPLANVTVRMETPVIYFYTKEAFDAHVRVSFNGGSISQWYPQRSGGETPPEIRKDAAGIPLDKENTLDFAKGYYGGIQWDVKVTPPGEDVAGSVFKPGETPSWIYPRYPDSATVTAKNGQSEKYLFYRGLGNFTLPVTFSSTAGGSVTMKNTGTQPTGGLLVFESSYTDNPRWRLIPALAAGETKTVTLTGTTDARWRTGVYNDGIALLTKAGLNRKEADAMIQTWWPSYFEHPGFRVFWVVPREFTDKVLPLTVEPAPKDSVRVLVGRSEVMSPEFEKQLAKDFQEAETSGQANRWESDRYFPAYATRVEQLNKRTAGK